MSFQKFTLPLGLLAGLGGLYLLLSYVLTPRVPKDMLDVIVPELSQKAEIGHQVFQKNCAACHGVNAGGTEQGPPLIHDIYNPGHHGDQAFYRAVRRGVRAHHWPFGDMPPQSQVSNAEVADILAFIREAQVANGITAKPHKM